MLVRHAPVERSIEILVQREGAIQEQKGRQKRALCYGRSDVALRSGWEVLVKNLVPLLQGLSCTVLYTSPSKRCYKMASLLASFLTEKNSLTMRVDERLLELNFGAWERQFWETIPRTALDLWAANPEDFAPPGGESGAALCARVKSFWQDVSQQKENMCIISHGGPLRVLQALVKGEKPNLFASSMPQGSISVLPVFASDIVHDFAHKTHL